MDGGIVAERFVPTESLRVNPSSLLEDMCLRSNSLASAMEDARVDMGRVVVVRSDMVSLLSLECCDWSQLRCSGSC